VLVLCAPDSGPQAIGRPPESEAFPVLTATVDFGARGYDAFFGWTPMVRSTDNGSGRAQFEMDPLFVLRDPPSPYAFFGLTPTLFDPPSRPGRAPMNWLAHSFLATTPGDPAIVEHLSARRAVPLAGFSWGFDIDGGGAIALRPVRALDASDWNGHVPRRRAVYPTWTFEPADRLGRPRGRSVRSSHRELRKG
jgi:hypothetical protein